ncbi:MAG: hypothetical protein Q4A15_10115, partial [Prevotellaceae bacterium]|nr:hypothetical protein [Prevotellaceae bacterium]
NRKLACNIYAVVIPCIVILAFATPFIAIEGYHNDFMLRDGSVYLSSGSYYSYKLKVSGDNVHVMQIYKDGDRAGAETFQLKQNFLYDWRGNRVGKIKGTKNGDRLKVSLSSDQMLAPSGYYYLQY